MGLPRAAVGDPTRPAMALMGADLHHAGIIPALRWSFRKQDKITDLGIAVWQRGSFSDVRTQPRNSLL